MSNLRTLTVTPQAANFILGCIAERPYKEVAPLLDELAAQLRTQEATQGQQAQITQQPAPALAPAEDGAASA